MPVTSRDIINLIEKLAPLSLAEGWDNPGLQVGDPGKPIVGALLTLDVNNEVVGEAIELGAEMIVSHHPLIFSPLKLLDFGKPSGRLLEKIIKSGITVYSAHTNLDITSGGVNTVLAGLLDMRDNVVLQATGSEKYFKLVIFIPTGFVSEVHQAISNAGAGWIGNYSHCAFQTPGTGMFKPGPGTEPFIGEGGKLAEVEEIKLETIVSKSGLAAVLQAMHSAHPYEEVAYDLYPLDNPGPVYGLGLVGSISDNITFENLISRVKAVLNLQGIKAGGEMSRMVQKIAICGGAGGKLWQKAASFGAEVFITGDIGYHDAKDMLEAGLCFIDAGHYGTEIPVMPVLRDYLKEQCRSNGLEVEFFISRHNGDPFIML